MADSSKNPWMLLTGGVQPPEWKGEVHTHKMPNVPDDDDDLDIDDEPSALPPLRLPPPGTMKPCSKCKVVMPADLDHFYAARDAKDNLRSQCKRCCNEMPSMKNKAALQRARRARKAK